MDKFLNYQMSDETKTKMDKISEDASSINTELEKPASKKSVRQGKLERKANKIYEGMEGRQATASEQAQLKRLREKYDKAGLKQEKRQKKYAEQKALLDDKREAYANKMFSKGIIGSLEEGRSRFDNLYGITTRSMTNKENILGNLGGDKNKGYKDYKKEFEEMLNNVSNNDPISAGPTARFGDGGLGSFD